jgi:hypothetical protein
VTVEARIHYTVHVVHGGGIEHARPYSSDEPLQPGNVPRLEGRYWLVERVEGANAFAKPARYRLELHHPEGRDEVGAFRRFRADAPRIGHAFSTVANGHPLTWEVVDERLAYDDQQEPYLQLVAERTYEGFEEPPDHELEHTLGRRADQPPETARATFARAERESLSLELVALDPGEDPDWDEAARFVDALILEELEDDLIEQSGVDPRVDPRDTWLDRVKARLRDDLDRFRGDLEGDQDEIEEWDFADGRVFAAVGNADDVSDPDSGYGWMCRLVDAGALAAAGFSRVQKARLGL